jgi:hypothetical protein
MRQAADPTNGMLAEYAAMRSQIAEADKTCVTLLNLLLTASAALTGLALERGSAEIAWLVVPLWLVGHMYMAEKRSIIMKTAHYLRTEVETTVPGIHWETWHSAHQRDFLRYYPFQLECGMAAGVAVSIMLLVLYLQDWQPVGEPWFLVCAMFTGLLALALRRSWLGWNASRAKAVASTPSGVPPPAD